jgi:antitoxin MazE
LLKPLRVRLWPTLPPRLAMYILMPDVPERLAREAKGQPRELSMVTKVQKWGNSQGVRFPLQVLREANIAVGDEVEVAVREGRIVVTASDRVRGRYRLEDLLARMPEHYERSEEDWGAPAGREAW